MLCPFGAEEGGGGRARVPWGLTSVRDLWRSLEIFGDGKPALGEELPSEGKAGVMLVVEDGRALQERLCRCVGLPRGGGELCQMDKDVQRGFGAVVRGDRLGMGPDGGRNGDVAVGWQHAVVRKPAEGVDGSGGSLCFHQCV